MPVSHLASSPLQPPQASGPPGAPKPHPAGRPRRLAPQSLSAPRTSLARSLAVSVSVPCCWRGEREAAQPVGGSAPRAILMLVLSLRGTAVASRAQAGGRLSSSGGGRGGSSDEGALSAQVCARSALSHAPRRRQRLTFPRQPLAAVLHSQPLHRRGRRERGRGWAGDACTAPGSAGARPVSPRPPSPFASTPTQGPHPSTLSDAHTPDPTLSPADPRARSDAQRAGNQ